MPNPLITTHIESDTRLLDQYIQAAQRTPALVNRAYDRQITRWWGKWRPILAYEPPGVKRPIKWTSERQRKAYFASNGFGHGIPYVRTHRLSQGWKLERKKLADGGTIEVYNADPAEPFVTGTLQQAFHQASGWRQSAPILRDANADLNTRLTETFISVTDPFVR